MQRALINYDAQVDIVNLKIKKKKTSIAVRRVWTFELISFNEAQGYKLLKISGVAKNSSK